MSKELLSHMQADPMHKLIFYMHDALSKPGMDDFIKNTLKDQFPEVHQAIEQANQFHNSVLDQMKNGANVALDDEHPITSQPNKQLPPHRSQPIPDIPNSLFSPGGLKDT